VRIAVDACSVINVGNSGVVAAVLALPHEYFIGPAVLGESEPLDAAVQKACDDRRIIVLGDSDVDLAEYLRVAEAGLGDGETECIALAATNGWLVCSDDGRARKVASDRFGVDRVIGTIRLLMQCVVDGHLTSADAFAAYVRMVHAGAFLPKLTQQAFVPPS
jgi:predicted nucleic acid-binding protein